MVITVYADRRTTAVGDVASRLARAIAGRTSPADIAVLGVSATPGTLDGIAVGPFEGAGPPDTVSERLGALSARHAVVLVAVSGALSEHLLAACDASHRVLLVCDPSVPSVRGTQRALKVCRTLGYDLAKVAIVLHGFRDDAPLTAADAAVAFKREIFWQLPDEYAPAAEAQGAFDGLAERLLLTEQR